MTIPELIVSMLNRPSPRNVELATANCAEGPVVATPTHPFELNVRVDCELVAKASDEVAKYKLPPCEEIVQCLRFAPAVLSVIAKKGLLPARSNVHRGVPVPMPMRPFAVDASMERIGVAVVDVAKDKALINARIVVVEDDAYDVLIPASRSVEAFAPFVARERRPPGVEVPMPTIWVVSMTRLDVPDTVVPALL